MKKLILGFITLLSFAIFSCTPYDRPELGDGIFAEINTNKGTMIAKLEFEKVPVTTANFISLAEGTNPYVSEEFKGKNFYDSIIFHRVIKDFMIQGGDPTASGMGGPGYRFKDEFTDSLSHSSKGVLSMANAGPGTNGSQFFITHKPTEFLDGRHSVFGLVIEGLEVVDSIANVATESDRPIEDVVMTHVSILRNGSNAHNFDADAIMYDYFETVKKEEAEKKAKNSAWAKEAMSQREAAKTLPSGLGVYMIKDGNGEKPKTGSKVNILYAGYFEHGGIFDTNYEDIAIENGVFSQRRKDAGGYNPIPMDYSMDANLIPGFKEGMLQLKVGDKARIFIPSHLAYGEQGAGNVIPPNSNLIFDIEIVE
jgi:cyclophilin family peptidyl-prolyl cis-trans isomerase